MSVSWSGVTDPSSHRGGGVPHVGGRRYRQPMAARPEPHPGPPGAEREPPAVGAPASAVVPPGGERTFLHVLINTAVANITTSFLWFALTFWVYIETRSVLATGIIG